MTERLQQMLESDRETILLYSGHLRALNENMKEEYESWDWRVLRWEIAACGAMCAMLFLLGAF